jgi:Mn2+/Fe2+ NRAMP family transporter
MVHFPGNDKYKLARILRGTRRRGVPAAYRYPVFEIFLSAIILAFVVLVAMIVLAVLYAKEKKKQHCPQ